MGRSRLQGENLDVQAHKDSSLASTAVAEEIIELVKKTAAFGSFCLLGKNFTKPYCTVILASCLHCMAPRDCKQKYTSYAF